MQTNQIGSTTLDRRLTSNRFPTCLNSVSPQFATTAPLSPVPSPTRYTSRPLLISRPSNNFRQGIDLSNTSPGLNSRIINRDWDQSQSTLLQSFGWRFVGDTRLHESYSRVTQTWKILSSLISSNQPRASGQTDQRQFSDLWVDTTTSNTTPGDCDVSSSSESFTVDEQDETKRDNQRGQSRFHPNEDNPYSFSTRTSTIPAGESRTSSPTGLSYYRQMSASNRHGPSSMSTCMTEVNLRRFQSDSDSENTFVRGSRSASDYVRHLRLAKSETELSIGSVKHFVYQDPWKQRSNANLFFLMPVFPGVQNQIMLNRNLQRLFWKPNRFDVLRAIWIDTAATTIQRHWRGYLGRQRASAEKCWQEWMKVANASATLIQRLVRRFLNRLKEEQEFLVRFIWFRRQRAAVKIQRFWIEQREKEKAHLERLINNVRRAREDIATAIQKAYRGYKSRLLVDLEYERWLVVWKWDPAGKVVEVVGSFSTPPWHSRMLMAWDSMSRQYIVDLPRIPGRHELKFIVNGDFCCDGSLTVIADGAGHYNNVVYITEAESPVSPFKTMRNRLRAKRKAAESVASK